MNLIKMAETIQKNIVELKETEKIISQSTGLGRDL